MCAITRLELQKRSRKPAPFLPPPNSPSSGFFLHCRHSYERSLRDRIPLRCHFSAGPSEGKGQLKEIDYPSGVEASVTDQQATNKVGISQKRAVKTQEVGGRPQLRHAAGGAIFTPLGNCKLGVKGNKEKEEGFEGMEDGG